MIRNIADPIHRATNRRLVHGSLLIADAYVPGFPILYASANFEILTGYTQEEVRGRSCRFLVLRERAPAR